jgi:hypothetical protein
MIILALLVVLFFSLSSISAQSINNSDDLDKNILKSNSSSNKATVNITSKATTNSTKKTSTNKTSTTKTSTSKTKANTTTVNKKTLAKTSTSFINYVEKNGKFPKVKISNRINNYKTKLLYERPVIILGFLWYRHTIPCRENMQEFRLSSRQPTNHSFLRW